MKQFTRRLQGARPTTPHVHLDVQHYIPHLSPSMILLDFFSALPTAEAEFTGVFAIREKARELTTFFPFMGPHHAPPAHKTHTMTFTILRGDYGAQSGVLHLFLEAHRERGGHR
jgi:hypothetical protein